MSWWASRAFHLPDIYRTAAWEAGVWKALHRHLKPSLIVGASAGALNGWLIAAQRTRPPGLGQTGHEWV